MANFNELSQGQIVYIQYDNKWQEVTIRELIGDREPNPGRTLVEVTSPWLEGGWEIFDVERLYLLPTAEPLATEKQMAYLNDLGYTGGALTKSQASREIESLKAWQGAVGACHYCGAPAYGWGFFDEPACSQCGGK